MRKDNCAENPYLPRVCRVLNRGNCQASLDLHAPGLIAGNADDQLLRVGLLPDLEEKSTRAYRRGRGQIKSIWAKVCGFCLHHKLLVFVFCCLFIALVAVLDTWLVVKYADSIHEMEKNPICLFLIQQDPDGLMVFVCGKAVGNILVLAVLIALFRYWEKIAMAVTWSITFFQFSLVCYLYVLSDLPHYYLIYFD